MPESQQPNPRYHPVELKPYDLRWAEWAARETQKLQDALGNNLKTVEHFGSTSVEGLMAKPVIDLMPLVVDLALLDNVQNRIVKLGYVWHGEFGIAGRRFCTKTDGYGKRLAHLHCYQIDSPQIKRHLAFRDFLRAYPAVARAYEWEKKRAATLFPQDSMAYNEEKGDWIMKWEARALAWYEQEQATHPPTTVD
ncbi:GrpB family protein [Larkinella harenae]